jgi:hypothetical protein
MPEAGEDLEVRASAGGGCAAHVVGASADGQGGKHSTRPGRRLAAGRCWPSRVMVGCAALR